MKYILFKLPRFSYLVSIAAVLLLALSSTRLMAQDKVQMIMEVSGDTLQLNQVLEIRYTIRGREGQLQHPEWQGMRLIDGPNQSYSISRMNGVTKSELVISYRFLPEELGDLSIGEATFQCGGESMSFPAFDVFVLAESDEDLVQNPGKLYTYFKDGSKQKFKSSKIIKL